MAEFRSVLGAFGSGVREIYLTTNIIPAKRERERSHEFIFIKRIKHSSKTSVESELECC